MQEQIKKQAWAFCKTAIGALKPLFDKLPELDLVISTKAFEGMLADLQNLQQQYVRIIFREIESEGINIIQKST